MSISWHDGGAGVGILAGIITIWNIVTGRGEKRMREIAVAAVLDSGKFSLAGEQKILHEQVVKEISDVKSTVRNTDAKFDKLNDLFLNGRITLK